MSIFNTSTKHCFESPSQNSEVRSQIIVIRKEGIKLYSQIWGDIECRKMYSPRNANNTLNMDLGDTRDIENTNLE